MLIGNQAFAFCLGLKEIHCKKGPNPPRLGQWVFRNVDKKNVFYMSLKNLHLFIKIQMNGKILKI